MTASALSRHLAFAFVVVSLLGVDNAAASSYRLSMVLSLTDENEIRICMNSRFAPDGAGVELRAVTVDDPSVKQWQPLWELHASESGTYPVKCFRYGEVAGGLSQRVSPVQLETGKLYRLEVSAPGEHGLAYFRLVDCQGNRRLKVSDHAPNE
jgi:hypothetical protein